MSKIFIDTNILVYTADTRNTKKCNICRSCLQSLDKEKKIGVISTQVLQEFYVVLTKKLKIDPLMTKNIMSFFDNFEIILIDQEIIKDAIDISILSQISFWDSLIIAAAKKAKCKQIWSEDLNAGQLIQGVKIINPCKKTCK